MQNSIAQKINGITDEARVLMQQLRSYTDVVKREHSLTKQYEDREIFELLQNIDDAYTDCYIAEREASFVLEGNTLSVSNNGVPFSVSTLERLCQGGVSDKGSRYIGCKGIGFRSVLNWTDDIEIHSGDISVRFSREYAQRQYDALMATACRDKIAEQTEELRNLGIAPSYPILRAPECIGHIEQEFDTVIMLKRLSATTLDNIKADIHDHDKYRYILLFLPNITKITFWLKDEGEKIVFERRVSGNTRTIKVNGSDVGTFYFNATEERLPEKYMNSDIMKMAVAIPVEEAAEAETYKMYTFFPVMNVDCPFPALLHATFCLNDNRNKLDSSKAATAVNSDVFRRLLNFYVETVSSLKLGDRSMRLLKPLNYNGVWYSFPGDLKDLKCTDPYHDICRKYGVFYSVNGEYLRAGDNPVILSEAPPAAFRGSRFARVVSHMNDNSLVAFAHKVAQDVSGERYLYDAINASSSEWSSETRVDVFRWWNRTGYKSLPNLLRDRNGAYITDREKTYFLSGGEAADDTDSAVSNDGTRIIENLPLWAKIAMIDREDEHYLHRAFGSEIETERETSASYSKASWKRILPAIVKSVSLREQSSRRDMISPVNDSVSDNCDYAKEFLVWLSAVWPEVKQGDSTVRSINFVVPTADGRVVPARKAYLGENYGNMVGKMFFENDAEYAPVASIDFDDDIDTVSFFKEIGVQQYPKLKVETKTVWRDTKSAEHAFVQCILRQRPIKQEWFDDTDYFVTNFWTVKDIGNILTNIDFTILLRWIFSDSELKSALLYDVQPSECTIQYHIHKKKYPWTHNNEWRLPSFLKYVFANTAWFVVNGMRKAPKDIFISNNNYLNDFGFVCVSESDIQHMAQVAGLQKEALRTVIVALGAKTSYLDFSSDDFYRLLLELPRHHSCPERTAKAKKVSRDIYRAIIDNYNSEGNRIKTLFFQESENRERFRHEGMVLAKDEHGISDFRMVSQVYFSSSAVMNVDNRYMIDIPTRRGKQADFMDILFVKPYEYNYSIDGVRLSACNNDFQQDLASFIPCLLSYKREKKDKVCRLSVELIEAATIVNTDDGNAYACTDDYTLLRDNSRHKWHICVGSRTCYSSLEKERIADALVQVFYVLLDFPSRDFLSKVEQLFIYSKRQRQHLIEQELGSTDEIELTMEEIKKSEELQNGIETLFAGTMEDSVAALLKEIDWYNPTSLHMQAKVAELLRLSGVTLEALRTNVGRDISIAEYNRSRLAQAYKLHEDTATAAAYNALVDSHDRHADFVAIRNRLKELVDGYTCDFDDVRFDAHATYSAIEAKWKADNDITTQHEPPFSISDIRHLHDANYEAVREAIGTDEALYFANDLRNDSMLYFGCDDLIERAREYIRKDDENDRVTTDVNNTLIQQLNDMAERTQCRHNLEAGKARLPSAGTSNRGGVTRRSMARQERRNTHQGCIAEYLVVQKLLKGEIEEVCAFFGDSEYDICWKSGAAKNFPPLRDDEPGCTCYTDTNDAAGYDIEVIARDKSKTMYIEVKSSSGTNCSFVMSSNEYLKARQLDTLPDCYRVVFVSGLNIHDLANNSPDISFIDQPIDTAFDNIPIEYNMVFKC